MEIRHIDYNNFEGFKKPITAAIGNFDGLHLGHKALIDEAMKSSESAVITFSPHPSKLLKNINDYKLLTPHKKKIELLRCYGVKYLIIINFTKEFKSLSVEGFIDFLDKLNVEKIVCGFDFNFGYKGLGNVLDLEKRLKVVCIPKVDLNGTKISSTYVRELLNAGNIIQTNILLGRHYSVNGEVIYGNQVGRTIGFRTANLDYRDYFLPKNGVYAGFVKYEDKYYGAMINIGNNPTLNYVEEKRLEAHILDFDKNIYGKYLEVFFSKRLRSESKFDSKEELLEYLNKDKEDSKKIFEDLRKGKKYDKNGHSNCI